MIIPLIIIQGDSLSDRASDTELASSYAAYYNYILVLIGLDVDRHKPTIGYLSIFHSYERPFCCCCCFSKVRFMITDHESDMVARTHADYAKLNHARITGELN